MDCRSTHLSMNHSTATEGYTDTATLTCGRSTVQQQKATQTQQHSLVEEAQHSNRRLHRHSNTHLWKRHSTATEGYTDTTTLTCGRGTAQQQKATQTQQHSLVKEAQIINTRQHRDSNMALRT